MELRQTIDLMTSDNYKERFIAEYVQLDIRIRKLEHFISLIKACEIKDVPQPPHDCPVSLLSRQLETMQEYRKIQLIRAAIEKVELPL